MEIIKVPSAGFCFGVAKAVKTAYDSVEKSQGRVYCCGELIHNHTVIEELESKGLITVDDAECLAKASVGDKAIIRAHGVTPSVYKMLNDKGYDIIDATCPFVAKIHDLVRKEYEDGRRIVIIGDPNHPEVTGINGFCENSAVICNTFEEFANFVNDSEKFKYNILYSVVAQTTFAQKKFAEIVNFFKNSFDNMRFFDTICSATSLRQQDTIKIASQVDLMIVVGSKMSSNTRKLYDICVELCPDAILVESAKELDGVRKNVFKKVGVTAGASTPDKVIEEVIGFMSEEITKVEDVIEAAEVVAEDAIEVAPVQEAVAEEVADVAAEETVEAADDTENSFEDLLNSSLTTITSGQVVTGPISKIDSKGVYIDLGFKFEGFIAMDEFEEVPGFDIEQLKIGDEVEAMVVKVSDKDGEAILSKRRVDNKKNMKILEDSFANQTPVAVRVAEAVNGGVVAFLGSVRIFVPASQLSEKFIRNLSSFVGKTIEVIITAFEKGPRGHNRIVGSRKVILVEQRTKKEEAFWGKIEVGGTYTGVVKSLTPFGAFVDLGGYDGLIHMSELSWNRVRHPKEVLSVGQEVEVKVLEFDREKQRISLGYRKAEENPWFDAENLYQVGDILEVTVVRFVAFGVFVNIAPGVDGLVHISQISNQRIQSAADCLKIGQKVMAKIIDTNIAEKKINLSIRDVQEYNPEPKPVEYDEDGNPIVPEKKERPRRKPRAEAQEGENGEAPVRERKPRGERKPRRENKEETVIADVESSIGTSLGDLLAAQLQDVETTDAE